jgi:glycerophosphoryl diester phosphodiesterase
VLIECDVQLTKDGHLVMMHDETLDRTTNGTGKVAEKTLGELKSLILKDNLGNITPYKIPTLGEVLAWGENKTIVQLDIKKGVPASKVVEEIRINNAYAYSLVITYNMEDAKEYHTLDKKILLSATIRNDEELTRLEKTGIPTDKLVAFVGISEPDNSLYKTLHNKGIYCVLGTLGNLDRKAEARQSNIYAKLIQNGADILATDRPLAVNEAIKELASPHNEKNRFFKGLGE